MEIENEGDKPLTLCPCILEFYIYTEASHSQVYTPERKLSAEQSRAPQTYFTSSHSLLPQKSQAAALHLNLPNEMQRHRSSGEFLVFNLFFVVFVSLLVSALSLHPVSDTHWRPATATWYGSPDGDGSDGGACGYGSLVDVRPLRARVGAVSPILFKDGEGCGACYKVKCVDEEICSRRAVTIIVTDECPGGYCASGRTHFDLSGAAFSRMAIAGENAQLRNRGEISVIYRRTPCKYPGKNIAFHVNEGSTGYWLSLLVEFEDGDGDIGTMNIREASSSEWLEMRHLWGANWCIIGGPLQGPFSVKLTTLSTGQTLSAREVIPRNWSPKATYTSRLNFF